MYDKYQEGIKVWQDKLKVHSNSVATLVIASKARVVACESMICHAGLSGKEALSFDKGEREYVVSGIQKSFLDEADLQLFIEWLVNRSPFESAFPVKDAAWLIDQGCLIGTADVPANLLAGALIASRFATEGKNASFCPLMLDMIKHGVQEDLAFLISHYVQVGRDRVGIYEGDSCHSALAVNITMGAVKNFLLHNPTGQVKHTYRQKVEYRGVSTLFDDTDSLSFCRWFKKDFSVDTKPVKSAVTSNPFLKSKTAIAEKDDMKFPRSAFISAMVNYQHKIFERVGYDQGTHHQQQLAV